MATIINALDAAQSYVSDPLEQDAPKAPGPDKIATVAGDGIASEFWRPAGEADYRRLTDLNGSWLLELYQGKELKLCGALRIETRSPDRMRVSADLYAAPGGQMPPRISPAREGALLFAPYWYPQLPPADYVGYLRSEEVARPDATTLRLSLAGHAWRDAGDFGPRERCELSLQCDRRGFRDYRLGTQSLRLFGHASFGDGKFTAIAHRTSMFYRGCYVLVRETDHTGWPEGAALKGQNITFTDIFRESGIDIRGRSLHQDLIYSGRVLTSDANELKESKRLVELGGSWHLLAPSEELRKERLLKALAADAPERGGLSAAPPPRAVPADPAAVEIRLSQEFSHIWQMNLLIGVEGEADGVGVLGIMNDDRAPHREVAAGFYYHQLQVDNPNVLSPGLRGQPLGTHPLALLRTMLHEAGHLFGLRHGEDVAGVGVGHTIMDPTIRIIGQIAAAASGGQAPAVLYPESRDFFRFNPYDALQLAHAPDMQMAPGRMPFDWLPGFIHGGVMPPPEGWSDRIIGADAAAIT